MVFQIEDPLAPAAAVERNETIGLGGEAPQLQTLHDAADGDRQRLAEDYLMTVLEDITYFTFEMDQPVVLDSLMAAQVKSKIESDLVVSLPLVELLQGSTVTALAAMIIELMPEPGAVAEGARLPEIVPDLGQRHEPFPLNDLQQAYWIGRNDFLELGNVASHIYLEMEADRLDIDRATEALNKVIERQDVMRVIVRPDGQQQVLEAVPRYEIGVVDLHDAAEDVVHAHLEDTRARLSHEMRQLDQWPLFEIVAHKLADERVRLHISIDMLITDAQGIAILMRDWADFYHRPDAPTLPLELSFRDYVMATADLERTDAFQRSRDYWLSRIPSLPPAPALPLAKTLAAVGQPRFVRRTHEIDDPTWERFRTAAAAKGLTPSMLLCAAYVETLNAWSKNDQFTLNVTVADRLPLHPEVSQLVGNFSASILLAVDNSVPEPFEVRARQLQGQLWEDLDHRYFSGVRVLRELARGQKETTAAMPVVFSSVLGGRIPQESGPSRPERARITYSSGQTTQVSLDCQIVEQVQLDDTGGGGILVIWDTIDELYPDGLLDAMFDGYCSLLRRFADDEGIWEEARPRVAPVPVRAVEAARSASGTTDDTTLHGLFDAQVRVHPDAPAVISDAGAITYDELSRLSNRLARRLRQAGASPGRVVGVVMEKSCEESLALIAAVRSGAACVPIDPASSQGRVRELLARTNPDVVLTQSAVDAVVDWPTGIQRVLVDRPSEWGVEDDSPVEEAAGPGDVAFIVFDTDGTRSPNGVVLEHGSLGEVVTEVNRRFDIGSDDRVFVLSPIDAARTICEIFVALAAGAAVVTPDAPSARQPGRWVDIVDRHEVTVWSSPAALAEMLVEHAAEQGASSVPLRLVFLSGERLTQSLAARIRTYAEHATVVTLSGHPETSVCTLCHVVDEAGGQQGPIRLGTPIGNGTAYVLDEFLEPCPTWAQGEIYYGGPGLARGYWEDEYRTSEAFVVDRVSGARLFRSDSNGRYLPNGEIEFLGRRELEIKVGGQRVQLEDVAAAIERHPQVRAAVATAGRDPSGVRHLVGYYVSDAGGIQPEDIRSLVQRELPAHMVPSVWVALDALPLTSYGVVNRDGLPEPQWPSVEPDVAVAPRNDVEETLAAIWQEVLDLDEVSIDDNFFEVGGDSLLVLQVKAEAERRGILLTPRQLFENPTIRGQAPLAS